MGSRSGRLFWGAGIWGFGLTVETMGSRDCKYYIVHGVTSEKRIPTLT